MFSSRSRNISSDDDLLKRFNRREEEAFCLVYERYYHEMVYFAKKLYAGAGELHSQDAVQDLFLNIWENRKQFESLEALKFYLYLSIRNKWKNYLEHSKHVQKYADVQQNDTSDDYILASLVESETLALLYKYLEMLPPASARVISLGLQGLSNAEIAEQLEISIHTVYSHKQKAILQLRELLPKDIFHFLCFFLTQEKF